MSCAWTFCIDCETLTNHKLVTTCPACGSANVEQNFDEHERQGDIEHRSLKEVLAEGDKEDGSD